MKRVFNILVSLALFGLLIWWADADVVLGSLKEASFGWLGLAVLSLTAITFLMALRWQILARVFAVDISYPRAVAEYYIAQVVNTVLPGGVAGDVARALRVRHKADLASAAKSVVADRIVGQVAMFITLGVGLSGALLIPGGIAWPAFSWAVIAVFVAAAGGAVFLSRREGPMAHFFQLVLTSFKDLHLIALALVITALLIFSLYACARATGTLIPPAGWVTLLPLILSAMLIPISVGGWGWREGAAAALFPLIGASPSAGIAMGIAYGLMMMIAALPGLYFAVRASPKLSLAFQRQMETP